MPTILVFLFCYTPTPEIYTLSLHDALPISRSTMPRPSPAPPACWRGARWHDRSRDRKSTRLNSSHQIISYAVFCLNKKTTSDGVLGAATFGLAGVSSHLHLDITSTNALHVL